MLTRISAATAAGRGELEALLLSRRRLDFAALKDAMPIVESVLSGGRAALCRHVRELDGVDLSEDELVVDPKSGPPIDVDPAFAKAFFLAERRIASYHRRQLPKGFTVRGTEGASFIETPIAHSAVGIYVPGGRAFYPSSLLMGAVPARVAGVGKIVVATPPRAFRESPELRWAVRELGIDEVLLAGGAHGVAGLVSVARCTKVVGPGNRWVTAAKHLVSGLVSIDMPAGPSEVLIVATPDAAPELLAADLLAQAEHDPEAVCLLFSTSSDLLDAVDRELASQIATLPTRATAKSALTARGRSVLFPTIAEALEAGREVAAEHVQLIGAEAEAGRKAMAAVSGAVFLGPDTPTALGDYLAGPNHVLPTGGAARSFSGLSTRDFFRWAHSVSFPKAAARRLATAAAVLARFERLEAHARSLELRAR